MIRFSQRALRLKSSAIRNKAFNQPDIIKFSAGQPEPKLFPVSELSALWPDLLHDAGPQVLQYSGSEGLHRLRELVAAQRLKACGVDVSADNVMIISGSQEGIELSAKLFVNEGEAVACENPSYTGAFSAFAPYGPDYVPIAMDADGMRMDELERALRTRGDISMIYTIPDFQNPTGITMSLERRRRLAELAAAYAVPVIEDRPYSDLSFAGPPLPAVKSFDRDGWVVTLGSFSKIFCPGLRLAWLCADDVIFDKYVQAKESASLQCGTLDQYLAWAYMQKYDITMHIAELVGLYRARRDTALQAIADYFPHEVKYTKPAGGFFVWVELKPEIDTERLLPEALEKAKVAFVPGGPFMVGGRPKNFLRLSYSCVAENEIQTGLKRLGELLKAKY